MKVIKIYYNNYNKYAYWMITTDDYDIYILLLPIHW